MENETKMEDIIEMEKETWNKEDVDAIVSEWSDKYLRLYADFENYKKRSTKEKEDIRKQTKVSTLSSILDIDNDLSIAFSKVEKSEGIELILSKLDRFLKSQNIEVIPTDKYDPDVHEVISVVNEGSEKIISVVSKGYKLNGEIIRYPKVILG